LGTDLSFGLIFLDQPRTYKDVHSANPQSGLRPNFIRLNFGLSLVLVKDWSKKWSHPLSTSCNHQE